MWRDWSPEKKLAAVKEKALQGMSATRIGREFGVSRNAVIGVASRGNVRIGKSVPARGRRKKIKEPLPAEDVVEIPDTSVHILKSGSGQCKWPVWPDRMTGTKPNYIGKPSYGELKFCGAATIEGSPYCQEHHDRSVDAEATRKSLRRKPKAT